MPRTRIPTVKPRLTPMAGRFGSMDKGQGGKTEAERSRHRDATQAHRAWYKTARWQKKRWAILTRDAFQCQECRRVEHKTSLLHCDHIEPHRGDERLFWEDSNLQTLCAHCHNSKKQAEERVSSPWR